MKITHFTDELIADVVNGQRTLTKEERQFLVEDTSRFEECDKEVAIDLPSMPDKELILAAYSVWADYASGQV